MIKKVISSLFLSLLLAGCDSSVFTQEDQTALDAKAEALEELNSSVELIAATGFEQQELCSPTNSFSILLSENKDQELLCFDNTRLSESLDAGPVCTGGIELSSINTSGKWVPCNQVSLCGEPFDTQTPLKSSGQTQLSQLKWNNIPWGCSGELNWVRASEVEDQTKIKAIPINVSAPICPVCSVSSTRTCGPCGDDSTAPEIVDVFVESFVCNEIRVRIFATDDFGLAAEPYSFDGGATWQKDSIKVYAGLALNLPANSLQVRDRAGNITLHTEAVDGTAPPCPCKTPWGETLAHGATHKAFTSKTVACTTTCELNSQDRTCNNGVLSGTDTYGAKTCKVVGCAPCTLPWGGTIQHGAKAKGYNLANAPCKGRCQSAELTCDKGVLLGGANTYKYEACAYVKDSCDCKHAGIVIKNGGSKPVFQMAEVDCDKTCQTGQVTCTDGTLAGNIGYAELSCSPKICQCKTAWGGLLNINESDYAYKDSSISCADQVAGKTCEGNDNRIRIKCTDAVNDILTRTSGTGDIPDFTKETCTKENCGCVHLGQILADGAKLKVYKIDEATPPVRCDTEGNSGEVTCKKSGSNFSVIGDKDIKIYKYTECKDLEIPGTGTGVGTSPTDVGVGTGGGAGGGTGNSEGDGEGFKRRSKGGGGGCDINSPPYYCAGGSFGMKLVSSWCALPDEDGYSVPVDNDFFSQRIQEGGKITLYSKKTVTCGDSCQNYQRVVSCDHGRMSNKGTYKYLDCREVCP